MKIATSFLLAPIVLVAACTEKESSSGGVETEVAIHQTTDMRLGDGPEGVYSRTCGYCHGRNVAPVLMGRNLPPEVIKTFVRSGAGAMPPFRTTEISDAQLDQLATWISESKPQPATQGH